MHCIAIYGNYRQIRIVDIAEKGILFDQNNSNTLHLLLDKFCHSAPSSVTARAFIILAVHFKVPLAMYDNLFNSIAINRPNSFICNVNVCLIFTDDCMYRMRLFTECDSKVKIEVA